MEKYTSQEPLTFAKKIENFWYYHKWHLLAGLLIICIIFVGVHSCVNKQSIDMYVLYMINGSYSTQGNEELALKLEQYVKDIDDDGEKRVQIITVSFSDVLERTDQSQDAALSRLVGQIASGPALFYIFDEENYAALKEAEVEILAELDGIKATSDFLESDRFNAKDAGFFDDISGFSKSEKVLYFGMRVSDGIDVEDSRYAQIDQCRHTLNEIISAYN